LPVQGSLPLPGAARAQARRVRILVQLPEEPPELTPDAARALLHILLKAADKQKREADGATLRCLQDAGLETPSRRQGLSAGKRSLREGQRAVVFWVDSADHVACHI
jgi:hypothetical protein